MVVDIKNQIKKFTPFMVILGHRKLSKPKFTATNINEEWLHSNTYCIKDKFRVLLEEIIQLVKFICMPLECRNHSAYFGLLR